MAVRSKSSRTKPTEHSASLRIMVVRDPASSHDDNVAAIRAGLADAGYELVTVAIADLNLPDNIAQARPDMLIIESESAARDLLEHVCVATQHAPRPIVLFTGNNDADNMKTAFAAGVTAYIVDGLKPERVKSVLDVAGARFSFEQQLRTELAETKNKLSERKEIERAKGLLMQQLGVTEDDAYRKLRRLAMEKNIRLIDAAKRIIDISAALS